MVTCLGKYLLGIIYGPEYAGEGPMLACAMVVAAIQATGAGLGCYINATGRMWLSLLVNLLFGVSFVSLAYFMIPRFGPIGYLGSMAAAYLFILVVFYAGFSIKLPQLMQSYPLVRVMALFGVLMLVAIYVDQKSNLPTAIGAAIFLGGGMAALLSIPLTGWLRRGPNIHRAPIAKGVSAGND